MPSQPPFAAFCPALASADPLRRSIAAACRRPEPDCLPPLLAEAEVPPALKDAIAATATALVNALRRGGKRGGVEALVHEYSLSSQEGVALMCLAEALLRIPDDATRNALIRDKVAGANWQAHLGEGRSLFVNAATWGLVVTGRLVGSIDEKGLLAALTRLAARAGEPVIRHAVDLAMQMMGEQFVSGETIAEALKRSRAREHEGFTYSYDMLGEAAVTAADARRYLAAYTAAIHAIGAASAGRGPVAGPGISIKLSALHPRYVRGQAERVMSELLPRLRGLAALARDYGIGLNIDAEEADRLELSLDLLEALALDPGLAGWDGLGFVVQAYGKRCPAVIDWIAALARRAGRRIMVRLVKGAYWDSEIKRAQLDGLADFPVYTRKVHTDVAYIACARRLLAARDAVYPQFATHNAQTVATIFHLAGERFAPGDYEFQCLHGMGEPLYEQVVGAAGLGRPCRIYAPVGTHETLLAYLVRRLLENGANSSFVHRIGDETVPVGELVRDPVDEARAIVPPGSPHPAVLLPRDILGKRRNSAGFDLTDAAVLERLAATLQESAAQRWSARPLLADPAPGVGAAPRPIANPADLRDLVGMVAEASAAQVARAGAAAARHAGGWACTPAAERAAMLERAGDLIEERGPVLLGLIIREAGKSCANAVAEVREAVDFLRYYAAEARRGLGADTEPLGPVACISPWNFPLAIFTGQVAAALAAGNPVIAKPAEETPLIAAEAVRLLHAAGIPQGVLQFLPGDGTIGAALVADPHVAGVMFTGSTEAARAINASLARRAGEEGRGVIPLVAETGGQNAMIVDSSALAEQVTADVMASAFDSAGQRCSALRVLFLQEEIAGRQLAMLKGALAELAVGNPDRLASDIGPVISAEAQSAIEAHVGRMAAAGCPVHRLPLPPECAQGTFVAPTIIEIDDIARLKREVFGPVLHVVRYSRRDLGAVIADINATGYALTFGLHTRLEETVTRVREPIAAGNVYINRNVIGAVVGVQPFGGGGLSGTGPKAGGPLALGRLVRGAPAETPRGAGATPLLGELQRWLAGRGEADLATSARAAGQASPLGFSTELPGPVGERNLYAIRPRGRVLLRPTTRDGLVRQLIAALAGGNRAVVVGPAWLDAELAVLPAPLRAVIERAADIPTGTDFAAALIEQVGPEWLARLAARPGPIPLVQSPQAGGDYRLDWLVEEVSTSINTTAAGGNASLMALV
ncbi:bifunctional proline dehydrogenase/L-glutamate gamma-semialdehyde dehydrogenase PutA [Novosphingobium flavum]|uniref:Bifunctional protein PutA n=1 Tax=Novosphingobium flavum TaxID=1778672 RepID=A0A7X1FVS5_9SPHN|nr:bifunctional proline dehydrogenase/L-glutamate gamma-semialdehyde dehydrogenase PutA [Novosphingobium flavum]